MITQIYEICCVEDARLMVDLGVDHVGVVATKSIERGEGKVSIEQAQEIFAAVGSNAIKVLIPFARSLDEMVQMSKAIKPDILQLSLSRLNWVAESVNELRKALPGIRLMETIPLAGADTRDGALEVVRNYQDLVDMFIIDTISETGSTGITGLLNDWNVGREIVEMSKVPVILAGGLSPENVADAIRAVRPWGVDSMSHTNLPGSRSRKDPEKVRKFVAEAQKAASDLVGKV